MTAQKRPMEGMYLRDCLKRLAEISAVASSMAYDLDPLSDDDVAAGAEPLTVEQMKESLERISMLAFLLAREEMQATAEEWEAAQDQIL